MCCTFVCMLTLYTTCVIMLLFSFVFPYFFLCLLFDFLYNLSGFSSYFFFVLLMFGCCMHICITCIHPYMHSSSCTFHQLQQQKPMRLQTTIRKEVFFRFCFTSSFCRLFSVFSFLVVAVINSLTTFLACGLM